MVNKTRQFEFGAGPSDFVEGKDFVAEIPCNLLSPRALFDALKEQLLLPDYFGKNWDALSECLRDLSWITQRRVVLLHRDLPCSNPKDRQQYLSVLSEGMNDWKPGDEHEIVVAFPSEAEAEIALLGGQPA